MSKTCEQAANEARETAQVIRMCDYHPKKKPLTYPRFRKEREPERPPCPPRCPERSLLDR